jgi:hypothetical protein
MLFRPDRESRKKSRAKRTSADYRRWVQIVQGFGAATACPPSREGYYSPEKSGDRRPPTPQRMSLFFRIAES